MQEPALARAPGHFVKLKVKDEPYINKIVHFIANYCIY
jgi:hypothetical protein